MKFLVLSMFLHVSLAADLATPTAAIEGDDDFAEMLVEQHNYFRVDGAGMGAVRWNSSIVDFAFGYSDVLENICEMEHSTGSGFGENLFIYSTTGSIPDTSLLQWANTSVHAWYSEFEYFVYPLNDRGYSHCNKRGDGETGHFTAMMWEQVTDIGCSYVTCSPPPETSPSTISGGTTGGSTVPPTTGLTTVPPTTVPLTTFPPTTTEAAVIPIPRKLIINCNYWPVPNIQGRSVFSLEAAQKLDCFDYNDSANGLPQCDHFTSLRGYLDNPYCDKPDRAMFTPRKSSSAVQLFVQVYALFMLIIMYI